MHFDAWGVGSCGNHVPTYNMFYNNYPTCAERGDPYGKTRLDGSQYRGYGAFRLYYLKGRVARYFRYSSFPYTGLEEFAGD